MGRWDRLAVQLRVNHMLASGTFGLGDKLAYLTEWRDPHSGQWIDTPGIALGKLAKMPLPGSPVPPVVISQASESVKASLARGDLSGAQYSVNALLEYLGNYEPSGNSDQFDQELSALNSFMGVTDISQLAPPTPEDDPNVDTSKVDNSFNPPTPVSAPTAPTEMTYDKATPEVKAKVDAMMADPDFKAGFKRAWAPARKDLDTEEIRYQKTHPNDKNFGTGWSISVTVDGNLAEAKDYLAEQYTDNTAPADDKPYDPVAPPAPQAPAAPVKGALDPANGYDIAMNNLPGVTFSPAWAANDSVIDLKEDPTLWADVPVTKLQVGKGTKLIATEEAVKSQHVDKVVNGSEKLKEGYYPKILRTDDGDVIIDGNTRVAMYKGLGTETVDAQVIDARRDQSDWYATQPPSPVLDVSKDTYEQSLKDEKVLTAKLQVLAKQHNGQLKGMIFRIKQPPSLTRKINKDLAESQAAGMGTTPEEAAAEIKDALRYTMQFDAANFTQQAQQVIDNLKAAGYTDIKLKNPFGKQGVPYKDTKITAVPPGGELPFELQFHTPESLAVKAKLHPIYEKQRGLPLGSTEEFDQLQNQMIEMANAIPTPPGVETISV